MGSEIRVSFHFNTFVHMKTVYREMEHEHLLTPAYVVARSSFSAPDPKHDI